MNNGTFATEFHLVGIISLGDISAYTHFGWGFQQLELALLL